MGLPPKFWYILNLGLYLSSIVCTFHEAKIKLAILKKITHAENLCIRCKFHKTSECYLKVFQNGVNCTVVQEG
jgi:hypothetical protein